MVPANRNQMSLYQETKAGLKSLIQQTAQVFVGFMIMLLVTGGNPSGLVVGLSFCLGVGFVAWSEKNRLEETKSDLDDDCEPEAPIATAYSLSKNADFHNTNLPIIRRAEEVKLEASKPSKLSEQKRDSLLTRFFPNATQRTIIKSQLALVALVETEYEFCKRALETLYETQLQALTKICNEYASTKIFNQHLTTHNGVDAAWFLLQKKQELIYELDAIFEQFGAVVHRFLKAMQSRKIIQELLEDCPVLLEQYPLDWQCLVEDRERHSHFLHAQ